MNGMTPSTLQRQLEKRGITVRPDHAVWMTAQIESAGRNPADVRNKMIYIVQYASRMGWLTPSNAAVLSNKGQAVLRAQVMQTLAEVLGHPDPTVRASTASPEQEGHLPPVFVNPPPYGDPFALAAWCEELDIMN
jgi:hypothetical protein